jgi:flavin reductase (DIM6/NTAB) family NADH-FMN oxidoreductase RutF
VDNLAPYSQFNNLTFDPPFVMFSSNQTFEAERKDTVVNAESTGEFVWNMATWDLREAVNASAEAFTADVDEFEKIGLEKEQAGLVNVPMVKASPIKFECKYYSTLRLPGNPPMGTVDVVIGRVVGVHISEDILTDGLVDLGKAMPIARCGYYQYTVVRPETLFEMIVPGDPKMLVGLEGNASGNRAMANGETPGEKETEAK